MAGALATINISKMKKCSLRFLPLATIPVFFFGAFAATLALSLPLDVPEGFTFTRALQVGSRGEDVVNLQKVLKNDGVYPEGLVTGYFGNLTKNAVTAFQVKYKIDPIGIVGPKTRAKLNQLLAAVRGISSVNSGVNPANETPRIKISVEGLAGPNATPEEKQNVKEVLDVLDLVSELNSLPATTASLKRLRQLEQQLTSQILTVPAPSTSSAPTGQ